MAKLFLIRGVFHSGTKYAAELFQSFGFDVRHEFPIGKHGISSWEYIYPESQRKVWFRPNTYRPEVGRAKFQDKIGIIRHPVDMFNSNMNSINVEVGIGKARAVKFILDKPVVELRDPETMLVFIEHYYKTLNKDCKIMFQTETLAQNIVSYFQENNIRYKDNNHRPSNKTNSRRQRIKEDGYKLFNYTEEDLIKLNKNAYDYLLDLWSSSNG